MALAKAFVGDDLAALVPEDYNEQVKAAKVTITGNTAVLAIPDDPQKFAKKDGKWLVEIEMEEGQ
jgi:hypothetical protein